MKGSTAAIVALTATLALYWSSHAVAKTCKQVASCEEAVALWCDGYRRADADDDGIPCENICHSKEQVDAIRASIGC